MHSWDLTPDQAIELQKELRELIKLVHLYKPVEFIGGADISFNLYSDTVYAGIVILRLSDLKIVAYALDRSIQKLNFLEEDLLKFKDFT